MPKLPVCLPSLGMLAELDASRPAAAAAAYTENPMKRHVLGPMLSTHAR